MVINYSRCLSYDTLGGMMQYTKGNIPTFYSDSSSRRLGTCAGRLQQLYQELAQDGWNISIFCGHRGMEDQNAAFACGASKACWPNSKHNRIPSEGIDAGPYIPGVGTPGYNGVPDDEMAWLIYIGAVTDKAQELGIKLKWGGLFKNLKDLGHTQLVDESGEA